MTKEGESLIGSLKQSLVISANLVANKLIFELKFLLFWLMFQRAKGDYRNLESVSSKNLERAVKVTQRNDYISGFFSASLAMRKTEVVDETTN
jgi:hypothetical protein